MRRARRQSRWGHLGRRHIEESLEATSAMADRKTSSGRTNAMSHEMLELPHGFMDPSVLRRFRGFVTWR